MKESSMEIKKFCAIAEDENWKKFIYASDNSRDEINKQLMIIYDGCKEHKYTTYIDIKENCINLLIKEIFDPKYQW